MQTQPRYRPAILLFSVIWLILFVLYLPAAKAGFVTDFTGWLDQIQNHSFKEYVNSSNFKVHSLYQLTQFVTYIFYKLFGIHPVLWHLLHITLHALNCCLLFRLCTRLLDDTGVMNSKAIAFCGAFLFCISPYQSEVIVWESAFHFLQGLLLILLILVCVQQYIRMGKKKYAWLSVFIYLLSTYSLEVFYITPWLVLLLGIFYYQLSVYKNKITRNVFYYIFLPQLILWCVHLLIFKTVYGGWFSHTQSHTMATAGDPTLGKPAKYLFHLLLLGRFFSDDIRQSIYAICDSLAGIIVFYGAVASLFGYIIVRFKQFTGKGKVLSLLFVYTLITLCLLMRLWFYGADLVLYDRYTYFTGAFLYMMVAIAVSFISHHYLKIVILSIYALINLRFTIKVVRYWHKSSHVLYGLLHNIPTTGNKTIVLLNLPQSMHGVPMLYSGEESEYALMHNLLLPEQKINNVIYDGLSYNMLTPTDGAHVTVLNDSTIRVTLNQWGTWWWYGTLGANSYSNADYNLNLIDEGHFYELTLKKPAAQYLLLYSIGDAWKTVDMNKKNEDQY